MTYFEYFSREDVLRIHEATLHVLEKTGMDFKYDPALEVLAKAGCKVDGQRVFFPPEAC
jgi:trimethylamine--corrinoid protein Co-methyltransferase